VFAERREGDIAHHHHLVVTGLERDPQVLAGIFLESFKELDVHVGNAPWRFDQPLAGGIFADCLEEFANERANPLVVDHV
jgi:hypothetical protein